MSGTPMRAHERNIALTIPGCALRSAVLFVISAERESRTCGGALVTTLMTNATLGKKVCVWTSGSHEFVWGVNLNGAGSTAMVSSGCTYTVRSIEWPTRGSWWQMDASLRAQPSLFNFEYGIDI